MIRNYYSKMILKIVIFSIYILNLSIIPFVLGSPLVNSDDNGDSASAGSETVQIEDIKSMGVLWSYHRPDNSPGGNSTSWKLRWSPDGKMIAVVFFDNTTVILNSENGEVIHALGNKANLILSEGSDEHGGRGIETRCWGFTTDPIAPILRACAWSPNGDLLAIAGDHRLIEIYNTTTWDRIKVFSGHAGSILSLDWSPNGTRLASGEGTDQVLPHNQADCKNYIKIWNITTGEVVYTLTGHKDSVVSLRWSKNSSRLVSASDDRNLKMWDMNRGLLLFTLGEGVGHSAGVLDVDWSPNQTLLVSGSRDFKIRLWDANTGLPLGKPWKDYNCVRSTQWHPNLELIATAGVDQTLKIRNATTGKEIIVFTECEESNSEVMSARWSPDGASLATCSTRDSTVRLYAIGVGVNVESETTDDWAIGITIFCLVCVFGLILIYLPLRKEMREHRK